MDLSVPTKTAKNHKIRLFLQFCWDFFFPFTIDVENSRRSVSFTWHVVHIAFFPECRKLMKSGFLLLSIKTIKHFGDIAERFKWIFTCIRARQKNSTWICETKRLLYVSRIAKSISSFAMVIMTMRTKFVSRILEEPTNTRCQTEDGKHFWKGIDRHTSQTTNM